MVVTIIMNRWITKSTYINEVKYMLEDVEWFKNLFSYKHFVHLLLGVLQCIMNYPEIQLLHFGFRKRHSSYSNLTIYYYPAPDATAVENIACLACWSSHEKYTGADVNFSHFPLPRLFWSVLTFLNHHHHHRCVHDIRTI